MTVNERLRFFMKSKDILQKDLIKKGIVTRGTIINYLKDGNPIRSDFLSELKKAYPSIDLNWLLAGKSEKEETTLISEPMNTYKKSESRHHPTAGLELKLQLQDAEIEKLKERVGELEQLLNKLIHNKT